MLISVRPVYAQKLLSGAKTVELRRTRPRIRAGGIVLIYASAPEMKLVGAFEVDDVIERAPSCLWRCVGKLTGITRKEFFSYFHGVQSGYGIRVRKVWKLDEPRSLSDLRRAMPSFLPPQIYRYLDWERALAFI
jgi:predicted transcriptional regulator